MAISYRAPGAAQPQGQVQGQPQPVTTLHTASPPNASASERFSDRVSESDSSEDSTVRPRSPVRLALKGHGDTLITLSFIFFECVSNR